MKILSRQVAVVVLTLIVATPVMAEPTGADRDRSESVAHNAAEHAEHANAEHDKGVEALREGHAGEAVEHFGQRDKDTWAALDADKAEHDAAEHENNAGQHDNNNAGAAKGEGGNGPVEHDGGGHDGANHQ